MGKVKGQVRRGHNGARLFYVGSQNLTQGCVHQVRRCMIASRSVTLLNIDLGGNDVGDFQSSLLNSYLVNDQALCRRERIFHSCYRVSTDKLSHIAHLATTLSVKGGLVQDYFTFFTFTQRLNLVAFEKRRNGCVINSSGLVAPELRSTQASRYIGVDRICLRF